LLIFSWILQFWQGSEKISVSLWCALSYGWGYWTFSHLSVICISSQNPLFNSISHLLVGMHGFWVFLEVVIYSRNSVFCVVTLIIVSLDVQEVFNLKSCSENYFLSLHLPSFLYVFM
jgi:hypothetical protein